MNFELNEMPRLVHLNILPLGSFSMFFGMDWLFIHRTKVELYENVIKYLDDDGERRILQGKNKPKLVRTITTMQVK